MRNQKTDNLAFSAKNILIILFIIGFVLAKAFVLGFTLENADFRGLGQQWRPEDVSNEPGKIWELPNTLFGEFGYDPRSNKLIALDENFTHFFLYRQPAEAPEWEWEKRYENYVREEPVALVPHGEDNLAILSRWSDNYRLHNMSTGEPFTDTFKADYMTKNWGYGRKTHLPIGLYTDEITGQLRILTIYNGTASLFNKELVPLWQTTLLEQWPSASSLIISLETSESRSLVWILTGGGRISCLNLTDGTILWQQDGLNPAMELYTTDWMMADFDRDDILDIVCTFGWSDPVDNTTGFAILSGSDGSELWEFGNTLSQPMVLAIGDFDQDGTNDLLLEQKMKEGPLSESEYVVTAMSPSSNVSFWQKHLPYFTVPSGYDIMWYEFSVDEYCKEEPGLEILFQKWNSTSLSSYPEHTFQAKQEVHLVTAKAFSPLWNLSWSWLSGEDDPSWAITPLPDLNGDGQADIYVMDEDEKHLIRDGGTNTVYAELPCDDCSLHRQRFVSRDEDGPPILMVSSESAGLQFYSFNGVKIPRKESSNGIGNNSPWLWEFFSLFLAALLFLQKKKRTLKA
ncbi:MAG: hypothetical protein ACFFB3_09275 [Candidatus Hodarchaeota archaeon]